tara:strand:+ start:1458 stop:1820 length:363 start_codon:yes stop_codon:yes gene_type:complete
MKRLVASVLIAMSISQMAWAEDFDRMDPEAKHQYIQSLSPQEREQFMEERRAEWEALSDQQKLQKIEIHREEYRKRREAQWHAMSDQEKIEHAEKMMRKHGEGHGKPGCTGPQDGGKFKD